MENKEFIEAYEKVLGRISNIKSKTDGLREKSNEVSNLIDEGARTIRLVTIDITPSERFVSKEINVREPEQETTQCKNIDTDNYDYVKVTRYDRLVTNHKGFGYLQEVVAPQGYKYGWAQTYANDINYKTMLELITDQTKMMGLLKEFLGANKKKASQRVMDLISIQQEAKELLDIGCVIKDKTISHKLNEPVSIKLISINNDGETEIKEANITSIDILSHKEIRLNFDDYNYIYLDELELSDYPMFIQIIETLETTFEKINVELEQDKAKVLELNSRIESKLSEFVLNDNLDKSRMQNAGYISW